MLLQTPRGTTETCIAIKGGTTGMTITLHWIMCQQAVLLLIMRKILKYLRQKMQGFPHDLIVALSTLRVAKSVRVC